MIFRDSHIVMLGCFDTKGEDFSYLFQCLKGKEQQIIAINTGVMETAVEFKIDFDNEAVAAASGTTLEAIRHSGDRGKAVELMGKGAAAILSELTSEKRIKGVIGMGGGGGTFIALAGMQAVPFGIPKLCLSTLAAKDLSRQVGVKDITLMPSIVDVAGLNSISKLLIQQAAAAICGMVEVDMEVKVDTKKSIAISMFGNTTECVDKCTKLLKKEGYEVFPFHATGVGGATMESLIREGCFDAVLDITTTELADDLCGGICSAGPKRLTAASEMGIPQVVVPGCLDMVNFAHFDTVPEQFKDRKLYRWAPDVTLMRTNKEENAILGNRLASKLNASQAKVEILLPLKGISQIDNKSDIFYDPDVDHVLFEAIKANVEGQINVVEVDAHINDEKFARTLVAHLLKLIR
jgi:uncharacterized protein (UPF0261 family)